MDERKKFILTIIIGLAGLLFLTTRIYLPIAKDNAKRSAEYKQLKQQVQRAGKFSKNELDTLEGRLDTAISNLEEKFPPQGSLKLVEQLTRVPLDAKISFTEITHREPQDEQGYQALPMDVNMKTQFYDLIKYLAEIETSPLMIGVSRLSISKAEPGAKALDIKATFSGFRLTHKFPSISKYLEERYLPLNRQHLEKLLEPLKPAQSRSAVLSLKNYNPFGFARDFKELEEEIHPKPERLGIAGLSLKGILCIADEKIALINDTVVREGENIAGMKVLEIQDYQVVLMRLGERYIIKMGVDDEFIKP